MQAEINLHQPTKTAGADQDGEAKKTELADRLSTGVTGLDEILLGGFIPGRAYMVRGGPGSGKTTLGLHFLTQGIANGERALFITLGEPEEQIRKNAQSLGFDLQGLTILDLSPTSEFFSEVQTYDIFSPAEVEREPTTQKIIEQVKSLRPKRVFLDAMTQFRYLSTDAFQFHKQALSFLRFLVEQGATVLFTSEGSAQAPDDDLQFMSDGVIHLDFAAGSRTLYVTKFRGSDFRGGYHVMRLTGSGMEIFPRLLPAAYKREFVIETISSGVPELDELLHGGLERGTITIFCGPSGVGKTSVGLQFMKEAAGRGERSVVYSFEEELEIILHRCEAIHIPARVMVERGTLSLIKVEPLRYSTEEFACMIRREVEERETRIVMIDSVSGYRLALRGEDLVGRLHDLCKYLQNMGVAVLLVTEGERIAGDFRITEAGISYLADNIVFLRYMERHKESAVEVCKAIGVLKKRLTDFEKALREIEITCYGIKVGPPILGLSRILSGMPTWRVSDGLR